MRTKHDKKKDKYILTLKPIEMQYLIVALSVGVLVHRDQSDMRDYIESKLKTVFKNRNVFEE